MPTEKTVNYTEAMEQELRDTYNPESTEAERDEQIVQLAESLGKNTKSVRAKLVRMGLYVKKEYKAKTGAKPVTKETIVSDIARILGVDADTQLSGLEKATKNCLMFLQKTIQVAAEMAESEERTET